MSKPHRTPPSASLQGLLTFLAQSPTPFHAVANLQRELQAAGFTVLDEAAAWQIAPGGRYVVTRNDSSLIAFVAGKQSPVEHGLRLVGAHTDSPCLKIRPQPELVRQRYLQLGVEVYGGVLLHPWFDRDLSIAGRVHFQTSTGDIASALIDFAAPVACLPSLAIHLDREVNSGRALNAQKEMVPLLLQLQDGEHIDFRTLLREQLLREHPDCDAQTVLDYELSLYDTQPPALTGLHQQFIASARLDNLLSCYCGLQALLAADNTFSSVLVCSDHEEVGSVSCCGAQGPFLEAVLARWLGGRENIERAVAQSMLISADNAHGVHPNYPEKHDEKHGPLLNRGPVIKVNANQRYASSSETQALFRALCHKHNIQLQAFVARSDMGCGSTIGPITASTIGVKTLDIGVPTFAMHSIRELAGSDDVEHLRHALAAFFQRA